MFHRRKIVMGVDIKRSIHNRVLVNTWGCAHLMVFLIQWSVTKLIWNAEMHIIMECGVECNGVVGHFGVGSEGHSEIIGVQDPMNKDQTGAWNLVSASRLDWPYQKMVWGTLAGDRGCCGWTNDLKEIWSWNSIETLHLLCTDAQLCWKDDSQRFQGLPVEWGFRGSWNMILRICKGIIEDRMSLRSGDIVNIQSKGFLEKCCPIDSRNHSVSWV